MGYTVNINGIPVEAETAAEAIALVQQFQQLGTTEKSVARPAMGARGNMAASHGIGLAPSNPRIVEREPIGVPVSLLIKTLSFLKVIEAAGVSGAESIELMAVLGAQDPRGVGAKLRPIKTALQTIGFGNTDNIFYVDREGDESTWHGGPLLDEAITQLEHGLNLLT